MKSHEAAITGRLEKLRDALGIAQADLLRSLGYSEDAFSEIQQGHGRHDLYSLKAVCDEFDLSLDSLIAGDLDYQQISKRRRDLDNCLPEKYADASHHLASARPIISAMQWTDSLFGEAFTSALLRKIQIRRGYFDSPRKRIHPLINLDFFTQLLKTGISPEQAYTIGTRALAPTSAREMAALLKPAKSMKELYSIVHDGVLNQHFDRVLDYRALRITDSGVELSSTMRPEASEHFKTKVFGDRSLCLYRQGVYSSFGGFLGNPVSVTESSCVHQGDPNCRYYFHWT